MPFNGCLLLIAIFFIIPVAPFTKPSPVSIFLVSATFAPKHNVISLAKPPVFWGSSGKVTWISPNFRWNVSIHFISTFVVVNFAIIFKLWLFFCWLVGYIWRAFSGYSGESADTTLVCKSCISSSDFSPTLILFSNSPNLRSPLCLWGSVSSTKWKCLCQREPYKFVKLFMGWSSKICISPTGGSCNKSPTANIDTPPNTVVVSESGIPLISCNRLWICNSMSAPTIDTSSITSTLRFFSWTRNVLRRSVVSGR